MNEFSIARLGLAFTLLAIAMAPVRAETVPSCEQSLFTAVSPQSSGRITTCSKALADLADRMNELMAAHRETARQVSEFVKASNRLTPRMQPRDIERLASGIAEALGRQRSGTDVAFLGELQAIRQGMQSVLDRIDVLERDRQRPAGAAQALDGPAGRAVGNLDFGEAGRVLDTLLRIETKVDLIINPTESKLLLIEQDRPRIRAKWDRFIAAGGIAQCPRQQERVARLVAQSEAAEKAGNFQSARNILVTLDQPLDLATAALDMRAAIERSQEDQYQRERADALGTLQRIDQDLRVRQADVDDKERNRAEQLRYRIEEQEKAIRSQSETIEALRNLLAEEDRKIGALQSPRATADTAEQRESDLRVARTNRENARSGLAQTEETVAAVRAEFKRDRQSVEWPASPTSSAALLVNEAKKVRDRDLAATRQLQEELERARRFAQASRWLDATNALRAGINAANAMQDGRPVIDRPPIRVSGNATLEASCH